MDNNNLQSVYAKEAIKWVQAKVRYRHRGTTMQGCDCTGLLIGIARAIGYLGKYVLRMYPRDWNLHSGAGNYVVEELNRVGNEISNNETGNGDILIFRFGKCLAHVGIVVNWEKRLFVHSFFSAGYCKYGVLKNSMWSKRWVKTYRLNREKMAKYS